MKTKTIFTQLAVFTIFSVFTAVSFASGESVDINVGEWSLTLNKTKIKAGTIHIGVQNSGKETHELAIIKLNKGVMTDVGKLPVNKHGAIDEDSMSFGQVIGEIEDISSGNKASKHFNLEKGRYAVICNISEKEPDGSIEAHYAMGMSALLEVE